MSNLKFKTKSIRKFEEESGISIYELVNPAYTQLIQLIMVGAECSEDEACVIMDDLREKHGNLSGVTDHLIDVLEAKGVFNDAVPATLFKITLKRQSHKAKLMMLAQSEISQGDLHSEDDLSTMGVTRAELDKVKASLEDGDKGAEPASGK